jgi:putative membrane protein
MNLLLSWLVLTVAFWITAAILPGFHLKSFGSTFLVAALFGVLNALLGWVLWTVFAVGTLGLALALGFVTRTIVNAILLTITDKISDTLEIDSFGWALGGAALISLIASVMNGIF